MSAATDKTPEARPRPEEIGVVLPVYNEEQGLRACLEGLLELLPPEALLVVDDGSVDGSAACARSLGIEVYGHFLRQGKGAALRRGFNIWLRRKRPWVLSLDADGQHEARFLPEFLAAAPGADLVLGDRSSAREQMPWDRRLSNSLSTALLAWRSGRRLADSQCGFRLYRASLLRSLDLQRRHFDMESELLLKALLQGARVAHTPISCLYGPQKSSIHRLKDSLRFASLLCESLAPSYGRQGSGDA